MSGLGRKAWFDAQPDLKPERLVFIDETGASTKMARRYGRAPRGERCQAPVPHGHWKTTTFVGALHSRAFAYFGGVAAQVVPDNLKSGVVKACLYDPEINRTYAGMAAHYDTAIVPARPRKPRDKALNGRETKHLSASRRKLFEALDRPALKPLPAQPYQYAEWKPRRAAPRRPRLPCRDRQALLFGSPYPGQTEALGPDHRAHRRDLP